MKGFDEYYDEAVEPGKRERAFVWATAIGLQDVGGLRTSEYLCRELPAELKAGRKGVGKRSEKSGQKRRSEDRRAAMAAAEGSSASFEAELVAALGITRSTVQKHIENLKRAGRLRRIGPDKGGHWEVTKGKQK